MLFQFRIGRIPVQVHFTHLLIAGLIGMMAASGTFNADTWPGNVEGGAGRLQAELIALWVGIVFVSVLFHELGHAWLHLAFGNEPAIQLVGMGGLTQARRGGPAVWWKDALTTFA